MNRNLDNYFCREQFYYLGQALDGEYWLPPGFRIGPVLEGDKQPENKQLERVIWIDQEIEAEGDLEATEEGLSRAVKYADRFALFNGFELVQKKAMEKRFVIEEAESQEELNKRKMLGYAPSRDEMYRENMPEKGEICEGGDYKGTILSRELTEDGAITLPEEIVSYFEKLEKLESIDSEKSKKIDQAAKLYNISVDIGHRHLTSQIAYMFSAIDALDFWDIDGEDREEKLLKFTNRYHPNESFSDEFSSFVYVAVRCNHFHDGETVFDDLINVPTFTGGDENKREKFYESMRILHQSITGWITKEILDKDSPDEI